EIALRRLPVDLHAAMLAPRQPAIARTRCREHAARLGARYFRTAAQKLNQAEVQMKLGVALPIVDIGGEPASLREFAQAAEEIGYQGIAAPDHVLGANVASRPGWSQPRARSTDFYHDPFVLFGFLAGCPKIGDF